MQMESILQRNTAFVLMITAFRYRREAPLKIKTGRPKMTVGASRFSSWTDTRMREGSL